MNTLAVTNTPIIDINDCYKLLTEDASERLEAAIHSSDVSFGNNDDTLLSIKSMHNFLDEIGNEGCGALRRALNTAPKDAMIGLGC